MFCIGEVHEFVSVQALLHQRLDLALARHLHGTLGSLMTMLGIRLVKLRNVNLSLLRSGTDFRLRSNQHRKDQVGLGGLVYRQQRGRIYRMNHGSQDGIEPPAHVNELTKVPALFQQPDLGQRHPLARDFLGRRDHLPGSTDHDLAVPLARSCPRMRSSTSPTLSVSMFSLRANP